MSIDQFDYPFLEEQIANKLTNPRDHSKLMLLNRQTKQIFHHYFYNLPDLIDCQNTVLVLNQTKVFPARLFGQKETGGKVEILLLKALSQTSWEIMSKPRLKLGQQIIFGNDLKAKVIAIDENEGYPQLEFNYNYQDFIIKINQIGITPIPPYIKTEETEQKLRHEYQTIFAKNLGSSAAPTAGLHFTKRLLEELRNKGTQIEYITLHVGPGTFQNLRPENLKEKKLHTEDYEIDQKTAINLNTAKEQDKKIIAVGTTTTRTLESNVLIDKLQNNVISNECEKSYSITAQKASTDIFIYPPYQFKFIDGLITNFHLPKSSLLMLVSAFVSAPQSQDKFENFEKSLVGQAYQKALENNYRFYSFGDAMLII
ncbi:tRNA preQ1(34) S-adenosylmethionine ribosyltransferase-isomerase QueA [Candidatus Beckwithbacteria bacterium]|nr:tRNA preQ1(34) S-adenosylmethionine ribosyltransferase-isomerase QueA [Candidatus Beckwithbacteria bacterium]